MKTARFSMALSIAASGMGLLLSASAHAELSAGLVELMMRPAPRLALTMSADGRAISEALLGSKVLLKTTDAAAMRLQAQTMVRELNQPLRGHTAEELYLRLARVELRANVGDPLEPLMIGEREIDANGLLRLQRIAAEELALRPATFWEKVRGLEPSYSGEIEFAPREASYANAREAFLASASSQGSPLERAGQVLRELAKKPDLAYLIYATPEGRALRAEISGASVAAGIQQRDPAELMIENLLADPAKADLTLQLALRLELADHAITTSVAKIHGAPKRIRHKLADLAAAKFLKLAPGSNPAAYQFAD